MWAVAKDLAPLFADIDRLIAANSARVQAAMAAVKLGPHHWAGSTGYGHGDLGREALDEVRGARLRVWDARKGMPPPSGQD